MHALQSLVCVDETARSLFLNGKTVSILGRIHSAVISGINASTRSVTVEWFERGETKGKEVGLLLCWNINRDYVHMFV